jgi:hypothetical protein
MLNLYDALVFRDTGEFPMRLKHAIEALDAGHMPLHQCVNQGGQVDASDMAVTVLDVTEVRDDIRARIGVFFTEVVGGCSCGDEPFEQPVYCELGVTIDRQSGDAVFNVIETAGQGGI